MWTSTRAEAICLTSEGAAAVLAGLMNRHEKNLRTEAVGIFTRVYQQYGDNLYRYVTREGVDELIYGCCPSHP